MTDAASTPTRDADDVIAELEQMDRGRYAGPVGWMDASGDGEWGIALRCGAQTSPTSLRLYAGCGIVAGSDAESSDYAESADDAESALDAVTSRGLQPVTSLVRRSSLEDVFLHLTGRTLVD